MGELVLLRQRINEFETAEAERKRAEDALRQSEHNYRVLFESTLDGMFVASVSDGIAAVNMLRWEHFDVALVDSLAEGVEVACCCISKLFRIPVILLVSESDVDWKRLQLLEPHGYICGGPAGLRWQPGCGL